MNSARIAAIPLNVLMVAIFLDGWISEISTAYSVTSIEKLIN